MNTKTRVTLVSMLLGIATAIVAVPTDAASDGAARAAPPASNAFGNSLTEWLGIYWRWYWGTAQDPSQSKVGQVQLMPLPAGQAIGGSGTSDDPVILQGELAITLRPGTPFVLPFVALTGERYDGYPGVPDDDPAFFSGTTMSATLTIDGRTVVSAANDAAFFVPPTYFDPIVLYPAPTDYGSVAAIWFEGLGMVSPPLSVGVHVIHLDSTLIVPGLFGEIFHNTWIVTISPR